MVSLASASWPTPKQPPVLDIRRFGAIGDNITSNTAAFQASVQAIAAAGGGTLLVPTGTWLTGPFNLTSNMTLFLASGATIQGSTNMTEWPLMPPMKSYGMGRDHPGPRHVSLLHGFSLHDVVIGGENGTVNGGGQFWWDRHRSGEEQHTRGHLFECMNCTQLLFQDVTFTNSPFWTVHPVFSRGVTARRLTILNDHYSPNTDGFDPDSTSDVLLEDSFFSTGDDGVAIKSGWDCYGVAVGIPSSNITIRNLTVISPTSAGVCIGSEMSGGVSDVYVSQSTFINCSTGIRIKSGRDRGGYVRDIHYNDIQISNSNSAAIMVNAFYGGSPVGCPATQQYPPPSISALTFSNIQVTANIGNSMQLSGLLDTPTEGVSVVNVSFAGNATYSCQGGVSGHATTLTPIPPAACGLLEV